MSDMEIDQFAATVAHEICNRECWAFTGEGPKPHSAQCEAATLLIRDAIRKVCDPLQAEADRLRSALAPFMGADNAYTKSLPDETIATIEVGPECRRLDCSPTLGDFRRTSTLK